MHASALHRESQTRKERRWLHVDQFVFEYAANIPVSNLLQKPFRRIKSIGAVLTPQQMFLNYREFKAGNPAKVHTFKIRRRDMMEMRCPHWLKLIAETFPRPMLFGSYR
jgi:hypothetical protein